MSEMVERVARAYANAWSADIKEHLGMDVPPWKGMGEGQRAAMVRVAPAAIAAMRYLTDEMLIAASDAGFKAARGLADRLPEKDRIPVIVVAGHGSIYLKAYHAAIDEALK